MPIRAVIFDVDGLLVDSEASWHKAAVDFIGTHGRSWTENDHRRNMGATPQEWARYMREHFDLAATDETIQASVMALVMQRYEEHLPVFPGALEAVRTAAAAYHVAVASGSPCELIRRVASLTGLGKVFQTIVSGEDVLRGKPAPDIYLEAARRLDVPPHQCVGVEDSANGILALKAAGMFCIAVPSAAYPVPRNILDQANRVLRSLRDFSVNVVASLDRS